MSHLTLQRSESPSDCQLDQCSPTQDSPTIGRAAVDFLSIDTTNLPSLSLAPLTSTANSSSTSTTRLSLTPPDDSRSGSQPAVITKPLGSSTSLPSMAGSSTALKADAMKGAPRTSSIDSAMSAISSRNSAQPGSQDASADVANLIRAAGSPEAVIQYLLKEKNSQSQQNAQLWRLVDKQRAMILGLNKDLERALKEKEKYRKKLKDVMTVQDEQAKHETLPAHPVPIPRVDVNVPKDRGTDVSASPSNLDSDSIKNSPVDMSLAPYPITPPADQMMNAPPSAVGELLDPSHAMPKASEHALDHFDREEEDRAAEAAKRAAEAAKELPLSVALPPSRSLPSEPPRGPPPEPPTAHPPAVSVIEPTPLIDMGIAQFPAPPAPPPPTMPPEDENESESDYDSLLGVDELPVPEKRGRRRTREEDDREREIILQKEAEARSLSKKSKKGSQKGTPKTVEPENPPTAISPSPRLAPVQPMPTQESATASLNLFVSPKRRAALHSPPLSPRGIGTAMMPLSPRAPRQPIPLPPNTPRSTASGAEALNLSSPKPLNISKQAPEPDQSSPTSSQDSPVERTKIYKGFVTDEYPDLLLPPNALPSIAVRVASSRMKPSRANPVFTLAIYSRSEGGELWRVEKDTSSFGKLDHRMKQCAQFTVKTPDRSLFAGHSPAKLDARRSLLDHYLEELLNTPLDLQTALELCKYLSCNTLPPNADDASSSAEKNSEVGTQQKGPGGRPFRQGYLTKRGKNFGGWKARFFVLDGPHLKYYEAPGGSQIGKQSQQTNDDNQYRHAFLVLEPKKKDSTSHVKHVLCAESDKERDQWVEALLQVSNASDVQARSGSGSQGHANTTANAKKKPQAQGKSQGQNNTQDELIGMSYDTTKQGDIPGGDRQNNSAYTISGPKDPQLIADSATWGGKSALLPPGPSVEEKKQRKRSFFGFGPKARTSTDDQDNLFGSSAGSGPQGQGEYRGPVRQVFGAALGDAVRFNAPVDVDVPLPAVVYRCIQYLDAKNAIREEGIFRLSGSNVVIKQLRERFNTEGDVNILTDQTYYDIHAVASLLKLYLRELPTTILTRDLHAHFVSVIEIPNHREKIQALSELVQRLPLPNETLLKYLIAFLIKIINHADANKMTVRNVGIVFSPTLNIPAPVFAMLLQNYEGIFGIDPEEYELPSPVSDAPVEPQPRRPSTAGPSDSPHRQRMVEQTQQRSTPTPPPAVMGGNLRPTPTPPLRQSYEPQFLAQQGVGPHTSMRPAYESGLFVPSGFDPTMNQIPAAKQPTYDRPLYGTSYEQDYSGASNAAYDQSFTNRAKRRESSMLMMGNPLHPQGSNSRLREETRM
ncbi:hypothetical protein F4810DRAFT_698972 [Camillea tinctor]|nr:hypothetical protein F4810DRAFT_698972 [Camillea tinctor]